jgi:E3 ubiquitin-protein ligase SHPRH
MILANRAKKRALNELIAKNAMKRRYLENLVAKNVRVCPICTCEHDQGLVTKCGHFFCMDCGNAWFAKNRRCPTCNQSNHLSELARVSQREDENSQNVNNLEKHVSKVPINGQFGTKVDALIRHIKSLQIENPQVKVLIFSQWELLLSIISKALSENNIGFVNIDGQASQPGHGAIKLSKGQSAVEFRNNPYITAFILNSKSQSAGLTLVSATHVFLIEHLLTQGLEKQAINRVHRIGQTKETNVWHYYIRGTIEESILKLQEMESNESELSRLIKLFPYDDGTVLT